MPCYTIQETQIEFGLKTDTGLLTKALSALGLNPRTSAHVIAFDNGYFNPNTGQMLLTGQNADTRATQMRQAYGAEILKQQAARNGWTVQQVPGKQFAYNVLKR